MRFRLVLALTTGLASTAPAVFGQDATKSTKFTKATPELIVAGKVVFLKHCSRCHGVDGGGNGPDEGKLPIAPTNFQKVKLKYGDSLDALVMTVTKGRSELVMPSFEKALSDEQTWAVAHFVKSMLPAKYDN